MGLPTAGQSPCGIGIPPLQTPFGRCHSDKANLALWRLVGPAWSDRYPSGPPDGYLYGTNARNTLPYRDAPQVICLNIEYGLLVTGSVTYYLRVDAGPAEYH